MFKPGVGIPAVRSRCDPWFEHIQDFGQSRLSPARENFDTKSARPEETFLEPFMIEYFPRVLNYFLNQIGRFIPKFGVIPDRGWFWFIWRVLLRIIIRIISLIYS